MKLTCLSAGGVHAPACHAVELAGHRLLLDCPLDLAALAAYAPVGSDEATDGLIRAAPFYKSPGAVFWEPALVDAVLVSSPAGMLGLPFLMRHPRFPRHAKVFATEAAARIGHLMMNELVAMHAEFVEHYGPDENSDLPRWMAWDEIERLQSPFKELLIGEEGEELCNWMPLYSAAEISQCISRIHYVKFSEEVCFNNTLILVAYSSGMELGSCNWVIKSPGRNMTYLSSSIFWSTTASEFDYMPLRGNDAVLFSDYSFLYDKVDVSVDSPKLRNIPVELTMSDLDASDLPVLRSNGDVEDEFAKYLSNNDESVDEMSKIDFLCSYIVDALKIGGSILVPVGRISVTLLLLEHISKALTSSAINVPIFMVSETAEEMLSLTSSMPEWLCKSRQEKLFSGEVLFDHVELLKEGKLFTCRNLYSKNLL